MQICKYMLYLICTFTPDYEKSYDWAVAHLCCIDTMRSAFPMGSHAQRPAHYGRSVEIVLQRYANQNNCIRNCYRINFEFLLASACQPHIGLAQTHRVCRRNIEANEIREIEIMCNLFRLRLAVRLPHRSLAVAKRLLQLLTVRARNVHNFRMKNR